jgi:uncharacterized membrane protein YagU involved in acid resistance
MLRISSQAGVFKGRPSYLLTGVAAGLLAGAVTGRTDRFLDRFVTPRQKRRDRRVRKGSAHEMAGPFFARKLSGKKLSRQEEKRARTLFNVAYGVGWGLIHAALRKRFPGLSRLGGLPFAIPFFFACDGMIAPKLGISPGLRRIPWQPSAKEMINHIAWTAACEVVHKGVARKVR